MKNEQTGYIKLVDSLNKRILESFGKVMYYYKKYYETYSLSEDVANYYDRFARDRIDLIEFNIKLLHDVQKQFQLEEVTDEKS